MSRGKGDQYDQRFEICGIPVQATPEDGRTWRVRVVETGTAIAVVRRTDANEGFSGTRSYITDNHPNKSFRTIEDAVGYMAAEWRQEGEADAVTEREPWSARDQFKRNAAYTLARESLNGPARSPVNPLEGIISAYDLCQMEFPEPRWAVPGVIPDGATLFVGAPKLGKSYLLLATALAIAYGGKALGRIDVEQGEVLLLCLEDNLRRLKARILAMTGYDAVPAGLSLHTKWPTLDEGGADYLAEWAAAHPDARMMAVDTLIKMRSPRQARGDLYAADYELMATVKALADSTGMAVPVVHHTNKNVGAEDPLDRVSGTNGLAAASDTILVMSKERGSSDANLYLRGRDVEESDFALGFDPVTGLWSITGDAATAKMPEPRREIVALLQEEGPMTPKAIADALGHKRATIRGLCMRMFDSGQLVARDGIYSYNPPTPSTPSTVHDGGQMAAPW